MCNAFFKRCVIRRNMIQLWTVIHKLKTNGNLSLKVFGVNFLLYLFACLCWFSRIPQNYTTTAGKWLPPPTMARPNGFGTVLGWLLPLPWVFSQKNHGGESYLILPLHISHAEETGTRKRTNVRYSWPLSDLGWLWFTLWQHFPNLMESAPE